MAPRRGPSPKRGIPTLRGRSIGDNKNSDASGDVWLTAPVESRTQYGRKLGTATAVSALALYDVALGSSSFAAVEGSLDGAAWTTLATPISTKQYQLVTLAGCLT